MAALEARQLADCGPAIVSQHYCAPVGDDRLREAWDAALDRYRELDNWAAQFDVTLLEQLRGRWEHTVRPDTSMFRLLFTRPGSTGYHFDECVEVEPEASNRVRMALVRQVPRRGEKTPAGPVTVTADYTRPENALPAVEALLLQLADPDDASPPVAPASV